VNPRAIFFDAGGVLVKTVDYTKQLEWEQRLGLSTNTLVRTVWESPISQKATIGQATVDEVWQAVAEEFKLNPEARNQLSEDFWSGGFFDHELKHLMGKLRQHYKVAIISDAWPDGHERCTDLFGLDTVTDAMFFSDEMGMTKSNPEIFRKVLKHFDLEPQDALFIDDSQGNIKVAQSVGLHTIHFENRDEVLQRLQTLL
jgi:FMN phosphatase YigB (HAD superfamily)